MASQIDASNADNVISIFQSGEYPQGYNGGNGAEQVQVEAGRYFAFYMVQDATTAAATAAVAQSDPSPNVWFSIYQANIDGQYEHFQKVTSTFGGNSDPFYVEGVDAFRVEDLSNDTGVAPNARNYPGNDMDFNDAIFSFKPLAEVSISSTSSVAEEGGTGQFTLSRTGSTLDALVVDLALSGDAEIDIDYEFTDASFVNSLASITIPEGESSVDIAFTALGDEIFEGEEEIEVEIASSANYVAASTGSSQVAILDDDFVDIDMDSNSDLAIDPDNSDSGTDDPIEESSLLSNAFVWINFDDDDNNGVIDLNETPFGANVTTDLANPGLEDDLTRVELAVLASESVYSDASDWELSLTTSTGSDLVNLWMKDSNDPNQAMLALDGVNGEVWDLGTESFPDDVWVEAIDGGEVELTVELKQKSTGFTYHDTIWFQTGVNMDLDVNNDGDIDDEVDGVANYLPGEVGGTNVLSTGDTFTSAEYVGQQLNIIVEGIGSNLGVDEVVFEIVETTSYDGWTGNASDAKVEGEGKEDDFSFDENGDQRIANGVVAADDTSIAIWAKDTAAFATVKATFFQGGVQLFTAFIDTSEDRDEDKIADTWEVEQTDFFNLFHNPDMKIEEILPEKDMELRGPVGYEIAHKTPGDGLNVLEEFRGYVLDGGGYDYVGQNNHGGGHTRMEVFVKELLVEVDQMKNVAAVSDATVRKAILEKAAKSFTANDGEDADPLGSGAKLYYIFDQQGAGGVAHSVPSTAAERNTLMNGGGNRHAKLKDFVHVMLADKAGEVGGNIKDGVTSSYGTIVYAGTAKSNSEAHNVNFLDYASVTLLHELTHSITVSSIGKDPFDAGGHLADPDGNGTANQPNDRKFLMYDGNLSDYGVVRYSTVTFTHLDFANKYSVEIVGAN